MPCHAHIIDAYLAGLELAEEDSIFLLDAVPNRPDCQSKQADAAQALGNSIYTHWDESSEAPSKQRPPTASRAEPSLQVLALRNGSLVMPDSVMQKFPAGSPQYIELVKLKEPIKNEVVMDVAASPAPPTQQTSDRPRASGRPDWSIEGGLRPLDLEKVIALENVPTASLDLSRLGFGMYSKSASCPVHCPHT